MLYTIIYFCSIQLIEKKNQILFALTAQLEEQKQHNQIQEIKVAWLQ